MTDRRGPLRPANVLYLVKECFDSHAGRHYTGTRAGWAEGTPPVWPRRAMRKKPKGKMPSNRQPPAPRDTLKRKRNIIPSDGALFGVLGLLSYEHTADDHHDASVASYTCCLHSSDRSCTHPSTHGQSCCIWHTAWRLQEKHFPVHRRVGLMRTVESVQTVGVYA